MQVLHACELLACLVLLLLMHALDLYNEHLGRGHLVILFKVDACVVEGLVKAVCIILVPRVRPLTLCAPPFLVLLLQLSKKNRHGNGRHVL